MPRTTPAASTPYLARSSVYLPVSVNVSGMPTNSVGAAAPPPCEHLRHSAAKTAVDVVLLSGNDRTCLLRAAQDELAVDGLDGVHVHHAHGHTALGHLLGRLERLVHKDAAGDDGHVRAVAHDRALAAGELRVLVIQIRIHVARQAQVHRAVGVDGILRRPAGAGRVRRNEHGHVRQRAHDGDVLGGVMRRAVERVGHAAIGAAELHIQVAVAHLRARRDETQRRQKDRKRVHERDLAGRGKAPPPWRPYPTRQCPC